MNNAENNASSGNDNVTKEENEHNQAGSATSHATQK
jgi:hypothetical protein